MITGEAPRLLEHAGAGLWPLLKDDEVEDVAIQCPGEAWVCVKGKWHREEVSLTVKDIEEVAMLSGALSQTEIDERSPLHDEYMPNGERLAICMPPAVELDKLTIGRLGLDHGRVPSLTFRKHDETIASPSTIADRYRTAGWNKWERLQGGRDWTELTAIYDDGNFAALLVAAVRARLNILQVGMTGVGKAQPLHSMVLTPTGWRPIGSLVVGDPITCPDGSVSQIIGVFPQGAKDIFRITFCDGRTVECCNEHLWKVWKHGAIYERGKTHSTRKRLNGGADWTVAPLSDIRTWFEKPHSHRARRCAVPLVEPCAIEFPPQSLPIAPYALGVFLGDATFVTGPTIRLSTADEAIKLRVAAELPDYDIKHVAAYDYGIVMRNPHKHAPGLTMPFTSAGKTGYFARGGHRGKELFLTYSGETHSLARWANDIGLKRSCLAQRFRRGWTVAEALGFEVRTPPDRTYSPLAVALKRLGLRNARSPEKFIPPLYKRGSVAQRLALLQGLMDTEGSVNRCGTSATFTSTSECLARDVQELAWSLGARANIKSRQSHYTYRGQRKKGRTSWRVGIIHPDISMLFSLPRKLHLCRAKFQRHRLQISSIEYVGRAPAVCIAVDHPEQLYVTNDYVVTHNTTLNKTACSAIDDGERLITVEDTIELILKQPNVVRMLVRGDITFSDALKMCLRMRASRVMLQEVRDGAAAWTLINDVIGPHPGVVTTIHGHDAVSGLSRLAHLLLTAPQATGSMTTADVGWLLNNSIDLVIPLHLGDDGVRDIFPVWFAGDAIRRKETIADLLRS